MQNKVDIISCKVDVMWISYHVQENEESVMILTFPSMFRRTMLRIGNERSDGRFLGTLCPPLSVIGLKNLLGQLFAACC